MDVAGDNTLQRLTFSMADQVAIIILFNIK